MQIEFHRNMLADGVRNAAFYEALRRVIVPGRSTVADIGSGTGLLGFMASRLGAKEVFLYEQGEVIALSERLAKANQIRRCHFFHEHSTAILDPEPVDIVVSETLGNYAYEENILETLADAQRFLKPGGVVIPGRIEQFLAPVAADRFHRELTLWDEVGYDLDFSLAREMSLNNLYVRTIDPRDLLDLPARCWDSADLRRTNKSVRHGEAQWQIAGEARIFGFALWWECELIPGITLSTSPHAPKTHWEQLYLPLREPLTLAAGDSLSARVSSDTREAGAMIRWQVSHHMKAAQITKTQKLDIAKGFIA